MGHRPGRVRGTDPRVAVAGGPGFIGYHFVELLRDSGHDVVTVGNLATGTRRNAESLVVVDHCEFLQADACHPLDIPCPVDYVADLACPASPVDFEHIPIDIMTSCSQGTHNLLELALHKGAHFLQASTSGIYGDPEIHPQSEDYTGNVNITGPRSRACGMGAGCATRRGPHGHHGVVRGGLRST
jgi:nucleoside-diphosphate-sugar epimerase